MDFKAVIFDLDGTLLDTLEDIANSANNVLLENNFPTHNIDDYRNFVGDGLDMLITRVLPAEKRNDKIIRECVKAFREVYDRNWKIKTRLYDGVAEMLDELTAWNIKLAVLSNKPDDFTKKCVTEFFPQWTFDMVLGLHSGIPPKPDPTGAKQIVEHLNILPPHILYLGDTAVDMETATSSGMFPVGALWGFRSLEELKGNGAQAVIKQPQEILTLLSESSA
jgi:phosphoglycolate phosphatase